MRLLLAVSGIFSVKSDLYVNFAKLNLRIEMFISLMTVIRSKTRKFFWLRIDWPKHWSTWEQKFLLLICHLVKSRMSLLLSMVFINSMKLFPKLFDTKLLADRKLLYLKMIWFTLHRKHWKLSQQ